MNNQYSDCYILHAGGNMSFNHFVDAWKHAAFSKRFQTAGSEQMSKYKGYRNGLLLQKNYFDLFRIQPKIRYPCVFHVDTYERTNRISRESKKLSYNGKLKDYTNKTQDDGHFP